jgi:dynein heavy chain 1
MGRIFCGLCQVGAWGCFDEFNRLEERILSAVSQQILTIQQGLIQRQSSIELLGRSIRLNENIGIFITMNPGMLHRTSFYYPVYCRLTFSFHSLFTRICRQEQSA